MQVLATSHTQNTRSHNVPINKNIPTPRTLKLTPPGPRLPLAFPHDRQSRRPDQLIADDDDGAALGVPQLDMAGAGAEGGDGRRVAFGDFAVGRVVEEGRQDRGAALFRDVSEAGFADAGDWVRRGCWALQGGAGVWGGGVEEGEGGEDWSVGGGVEGVGEGGAGGGEGDG